MAYGLKLFYEWTSFNGIHNRVEIRDKDKLNDTGAIQCVALGSCFEIEYPKRKLLYEPIRSCGASLYFEYVGKEGFLDDFFTPDLQKFKVIHYQENNINFIGYLNTELYSEDYTTNTECGVAVSLTANNGFANLERMNFIQSNGKYYYGIYSIKDLLKITFEHIGLEYKNLFFKPLFDYEIDDNGTLSNNYIEDIYINNSNWVDEDGEVSNFKEIIEDVLISNGLQLMTIKDDIYIFPVNTQAKASKTNSFFHYKLPSFTKQTNKCIDLSPLEISDIGYHHSSKQQKNKITAINSQELEFDPYVIEKCINCEIGDKDIFTKKKQFTSIYHKKFPWKKVRYLEHPNFIRYDNASSGFVEAYTLNEDGEKENEESYLEFIPQRTKPAKPVFQSKPIPVYVLKGSVLRITVEYYYQTAISHNNQGDDGFKRGYHPNLNIALKSGDKYYGWNGLTDNKFYFPFTTNNKKNVNQYDQNLTVTREIQYSPLHFTGEPLTIEIADDIRLYLGDLGNTVLPDLIRIYSIKCEIVDKTAKFYGTELSSLVKSSEIQLNPQYKNKGKKISLKCGTMLKEPEFKVNNINQRGAFLRKVENDTYEGIFNYKIGSTIKTSEYWILNQIITNYQTPSNTLKATLNNYNIIRPIKDTPFLNDCLMIATGGKYDYYEDTFDCVLQEIKEI